MFALDHFVLAVSDLAVAREEFADLTGVQPAMGGAHLGLGTRNALLAFSNPSKSHNSETQNAAYLEIIAPDVEQYQNGQPIGLGTMLATLSEPTPLHWAIRTTQLEQAAEQATAAGFAPMAIRDTKRRQPNGDTLEWRLMGIGGHEMGGLIPFYIDWLNCPHPAQTNPEVGALRSFEITTSSKSLANLLANTTGVTTHHGSSPRLSITFETQRDPLTYSATDLHGFLF